MEMDEEAAVVTSSRALATAPRPGAGNQFALVEEFPNVKSVSDLPSLNVEDAPSERSGVEGRLAQPELENRILLDQAVMAKQTMMKHAEHIRRLEETMHAICELILEARPQEEEQRGRAQEPTGPTQVGSSPAPEVIMSGEQFLMPPPAPQLLAQHSAQCPSVGQWQGHASHPTGLQRQQPL